MDHVVAGPREQHVLVDAGRLLRLAHTSEEVLVGRRFPRPEAGAGARAGGAALLAVDAVVEAELLLEVEGLVGARGVLVADDVVRAGDHTTGASGAEPRGDDLVEELFPLELPAVLVARGERVRGPLAGLGHGHGPTLGLATPLPIPEPVRRDHTQCAAAAQVRGVGFRNCGRVGQHLGMDLTYPPEAESFRVEIRSWLEENLPVGWFDAGFEMSPEDRAAFNEDLAAHALGLLDDAHQALELAGEGADY